MKRTIFLTALWTAFSIAGVAQSATTDSIKAKIKQIKLSEKYIYAEATGTNNPEEVRTQAAEELYIRIAEELSTEGKSKEEVNAVRKQAEQYHSKLEYSNGPLHKAFAYISKSVLNGNFTPEPKQPPIGNNPVVFAEESVPSTATPATNDTTAVETDPDAPQERKFIASNEQALIEAEKREESGSQHPVTTKEEPEYQLDTAPESHQRVIKDILALDTYESVMLYLSAMKEDGRLMYGRISTLISPEQAYMIIVKDGHLVTVLNRGSSERVNLRTRQPDSIRNYKGYAVIWMKVF